MTPLQPPPTSLLDKYYGEDSLALYTGRVRVTGGEAEHGRASGIVKSDDGALDAHLRLPTELGGAGGGTIRSSCWPRAMPPASTARWSCWRRVPGWS